MANADTALQEYFSSDTKTGKPSSPDEALSQSGMDAVAPAESKSLTESSKVPFMQGLKDRFYAGLSETDIKYKKMIGLGSSDFLRNAFIGKQPEKIESLKAQTSGEKGVRGFAFDFAESLGSLGYDLPATIMSGSATKIALAGKMIPEAEAFLSHIPDFALGMGEVGAIGAVQAGKKPKDVLLEGMGEATKGLVYGSVGEGFKAIPIMSALGVGDVSYEALKQGRMPRKEEIEKGAAQGAAYGVLFNIIPALKKLSSIDGKDVWDKLSAAMVEAQNKGDFSEVKKQVNDIIGQTDKPQKETIDRAAIEVNGKLYTGNDHAEAMEKAKADGQSLEGFDRERDGKFQTSEGRIIDRTQAKEEFGFDHAHLIPEDKSPVLNISPVNPEHRELVDNILNKDHVENPETGDIIFLNKQSPKDFLSTAKEKVTSFFKDWHRTIPVSKNLETDFQNIKIASQVDEINAVKFLKNLGMSPSDAEALYHYDEDNKRPITDQQKEMYDSVVKPLKDEYSKLYTEARKFEFPLDPEGFTPRFVEGKGNLLDRLTSEEKTFTSGILRKTSGAFKERVMKSLTDEQGNRIVVAIKNGKVTAFKNGSSEDMGTFGLSKNIDLMKKTIEPLEKNFRKYSRELRIMRSRVGDLKERMTNIQEFLDRQTEEVNPAIKKVHETMRKELESIGKKIESATSEQKSISKFSDKFKLTRKSKAEAETRIFDLEDKVENLYQKQANIELSDLYDKVSEVVSKQEKQAGSEESANRRALERIKEISKEIKGLEKVKTEEDPLIRRNRLESVEAKMNEAQEKINSIIASYNLEDLNDKTFVDSANKKWKVGNATTAEIESNTNLRYHKNVVLNYLLRNLEMKKIIRATNFLEGIKSMDGFDKIAVPDNGTKPPGWERPRLPQFRNFYVEPRVADALNMMNDKVYGSRDPLKWVTAANNLLRTAIFYNPLIHIPNIANHWAVNRGVMKWALPKEYATLFETGSKAWEAVTKQNDDYIEMLNSGANLMYHKYAGETLIDMLHSKVGEELQSNPKLLRDMALDLAMKPAQLIEAWWKISGKATWASNDIATMQAVYEEMGHGKNIQEAIAEVGKHIPNYVLPSRILDRSEISKLMSDNRLTMFGAYHYGALKSYGEMMKSLVSGSAKEKLETVDKLAALALIQFAVYPALDKVAQTLTGQKHAHLRRAGASTFIDNMTKLIQRKKDISQVIQSVLTPSPELKFTSELVSNRDSFTGKRVIHTNQEIQDVARLAVSQIAPAEQIARIASGKTTPEKFAAGLFGVSFSDENTSKVFNMKDSKTSKQSDIDSMKDPKRQAAAADKFNQSQLKSLLEIAKEERIKITPKIASQFLVTKAGSRNVDTSKIVESMLSKQSKFKRKPLPMNPDTKKVLEEMMR